MMEKAKSISEFKSSTTFSAFWGCNIPTNQPFAEKSARLIMDKLQIKLLEINTATCCPENDLVRRLDPDLATTISGANFALAEKNNAENMVAFCNGCYHSLEHARHILENEEVRKKYNEQIKAATGTEYQAKIKLFPIAEFLAENVGLATIKAQVSHPLKDLKVACHYGCRMHERNLPELFDKVVETTGAKIVRYGLERMCCGTPSLYTDQNWAVMERARNKLIAVQKSGAEAIVVSCPACFKQFENAQLLLKRNKEVYNLPILHLTELIALSFGFTPEEIGMSEHRISYPPKKEKKEESP